MGNVEEEIEQDLREQEMQEDNVYSSSSREELIDEDEISPQEEAFMEGYENDKEKKCKNCGDSLIDLDKDELVEKEIDGKMCVFCSEVCAQDFED